MGAPESDRRGSAVSTRAGESTGAGDRSPHGVPAVAGRPALRVGPVSLVRRPRVVVVGVAALAVLLLATAVNIGRGEYDIPLPDVLNVLAGGGDRGQRFVVLDLRLPRSLTGLLVGAALGVAGAITQAVARNPLASPEVLGFTSGASAAAVFVIVVGGAGGGVGGALAALGLPLAALVGGLTSAVVIYALAWRGGVHGFRLVLIGIAVNAVMLACVQWMLILAEVFEAAQAFVWINGSLNGRGWEHVVPVAVALAVLVPAVVVLTHTRGGLQFGDDTARSLGIAVDRGRALLVLLAVGLAAVATAAAGPIAFVALVAPQIAHRLARCPGPPIVLSMIIGAALTVAADVVARTAFGAVELPVGIVTAVLGAPYLLFLLVRHGREARA